MTEVKMTRAADDGNINLAFDQNLSTIAVSSIIPLKMVSDSIKGS
jgi:hypothetical protein